MCRLLAGCFVQQSKDLERKTCLNSVVKISNSQQKMSNFLDLSGL